MPKTKTSSKAKPTLVIGIASSALFDLTASDKIFREEGLTAYETYQRKNEDKALEPGYAFPLIRKIFAINKHLVDEHKLKTPVIEIVLLSRNSANTGLRVFNSIEEHKLDIHRAAFCGGASPHAYAQPFDCKLFLSADPEDVHRCINSGLAAARIMGGDKKESPSRHLRFACDGDAVLFSDEAEKITENHGVEEFQKSEKRNAYKQLGPGPFKPFFEALGKIQQEYFPVEPFKERDHNEYDIRTALVTARAAPAHKRAIHTLRKWNYIPNECIFVGRGEKGGFLKAFKADIFFDDKEEHCESATSSGVPSGHVPRASKGDKG